jgi:hypothetical protein
MCRGDGGGDVMDIDIFRTSAEWGVGGRRSGGGRARAVEALVGSEIRHPPGLHGLHRVAAARESTRMEQVCAVHILPMLKSASTEEQARMAPGHPVTHPFRRLTASASALEHRRAH